MGVFFRWSRTYLVCFVCLKNRKELMQDFAVSVPTTTETLNDFQKWRRGPLSATAREHLVDDLWQWNNFSTFIRTILITKTVSVESLYRFSVNCAFLLKSLALRLSFSYYTMISMLLFFTGVYVIWWQMMVTGRTKMKQDEVSVPVNLSYIILNKKEE